jgi:hypothetical protein
MWQRSLHLIACGTGQGLLVVEHRTKIAHVKPAFKEVKLNPGRPMTTGVTGR